MISGPFDGQTWVAWIPPAAVLVALIGLAVISFWPRPPKH